MNNRLYAPRIPNHAWLYDIRRGSLFVHNPVTARSLVYISRRTKGCGELLEPFFKEYSLKGYN